MKRAINNTTLGDRMLFFALFFMSIAGFFMSGDALSHGTEVIIEVEGRPLYSFQINQDREISVEGPYGPTTIEIKSGTARIKETYCRNKICIKQGRLSRGVLVCLPNRLTVFVGGKSDARNKNIDAITG